MDASIGKFKKFLSGLATDPQKLEKFLKNPDRVMKTAGLTKEDQVLLKSGDQAAIHARLSGQPVAANNWSVSILPVGAAPQGPLSFLLTLQVTIVPLPSAQTTAGGPLVHPPVIVHPPITVTTTHPPVVVHPPITVTTTHPPVVVHPPITVTTTHPPVTVSPPRPHKIKNSRKKRKS